MDKTAGAIKPSLRFPEPTESEFQARFLPKILNTTRVFIVIGFIYYWLSYALDYEIIPDVLELSFKTRIFFFTPFGLLLIGLAFSRRCAPRVQLWFTLLAGAMALINLFLLSHSTSPLRYLNYYGSATIIVALAVLRVRFFFLMAFVSVLLPATILVSLGHDQPIFTQNIAYDLFIICLICLIGGYFTEITERREFLLMRQVQEGERRYRELFDNASDLVYTHDLEGKITSANKAVLFTLGYSPEELTGAALDKVVPPDQMEKAAAKTRETLAGKAFSRYEIDVLSKSGERVSLEVNTSLIIENGRPVGVQGIGRDIRQRLRHEMELKQAKDRAEDATRLKDKFVSLVSHDLRSPLASITGLLGLLQGKTEGKTEKEILERCVRLAGGMLEMIGALLDISRLQTGKLAPVKEFCGARALAAGALAEVEKQAADKGVRLVNDLPSGMTIFVDPALFSEVLLNLASNAVKFCDRGCQVRIYSPAHEPGSIAVQDDGVGIPEKIIADLFKHEVKTTTTGTAGEKGTGLGLPYCKDIMTAHGGEITAASQPGKGAEFTLRLGAAKPLILLVDDQPAARQMMKKTILSAMEADFVEAENGMQGLEAVKKNLPDLIVADISMPVMNGLEFLKALRDQDAYKGVPVIVATSSGSPGGGEMEAKTLALRMGASDFTIKPIHPDDFLPRIKRFLG